MGGDLALSFRGTVTKFLATNFRMTFYRKKCSTLCRQISDD